MNIFSKELKSGRKAFLFWSLGLFVLVFAGIVKSTGIGADGEGLAVLVASFPRIVLAVFGMLDVDLNTFPGFYAILAQYMVILTAVYAVHLGNNAVSLEAVDKTYEFVFTKPRTRSFILGQKLLAGFACLLAYCALSFLFSLGATATLHLPESHTALFARYALVSLLVGLLFFALGALFAALSSHAEKGARLGNNVVLAAFCVGVVYDMLTPGPWLRLLSPFKYFATSALLAHHLDARFAALCLGLGGIALALAFWRFEKRDLSAA